MERGNRSAVAVGALGLLAVPAFLIGAGLGDTNPAAAPRLAEPPPAPGRAAAASQPAGARAVSPAADRADGADRPRRSPSAPRGLTVTVLASDRTPDEDENVRFRVHWSDGSGRYAGLTEEWGDGTAASSVGPVSCAGQAGPHGGEEITSHRFPAGSYRVRISVTTAECDGSTETRSGEVSIEVGTADREPVDVDATGTPAAPPEPQVDAEPETPRTDEVPSEGPSAGPTGPPPHLPRTPEAGRTDSDTP